MMITSLRLAAAKIGAKVSIARYSSPTGRYSAAGTPVGRDSSANIPPIGSSTSSSEVGFVFEDFPAGAHGRGRGRGGGQILALSDTGYGLPVGFAGRVRAERYSLRLQSKSLLVTVRPFST